MQTKWEVSFYLEKFIVCHMCSQACQRLPSGASNTNQQSVTARLLYDAAYSAYVLNGKPEKKNNLCHLCTLLHIHVVMDI